MMKTHSTLESFQVQGWCVVITGTILLYPEEDRGFGGVFEGPGLLA